MHLKMLSAKLAAILSRGIWVNVIIYWCTNIQDLIDISMIVWRKHFNVTSKLLEIDKLHS